MQTIQQEIDERTNLTSSNKLELLLFRLGGDPGLDRSELFGINVFKIREILPMSTITAVAGSPPHMMGVVDPDPAGHRPAGRGGLHPENRPQHPADHRIRPQHAGF